MELDLLYRELCLSWDLLDEEDLEVCAEDVARERRVGNDRSLLGMAVRRGLLVPKDALHVHRTAKSLVRDSRRGRLRESQRRALGLSIEKVPGDNEAKTKKAKAKKEKRKREASKKKKAKTRQKTRKKKRSRRVPETTGRKRKRRKKRKRASRTSDRRSRPVDQKRARSVVDLEEARSTSRGKKHKTSDIDIPVERRKKDKPKKVERKVGSGRLSKREFNSDEDEIFLDDSTLGPGWSHVSLAFSDSTIELEPGELEAEEERRKRRRKKKRSRRRRLKRAAARERNADHPRRLPKKRTYDEGHFNSILAAVCVVALLALAGFLAV